TPIDYTLWSTAVAGSPPPVPSDCPNPNLPPLLYLGQDRNYSAYVLQGGQPTWAQNDGSDDVAGVVAGRTVVGLSKPVDWNGRTRSQYLYLVTVDGREHSTPQFGATFYDEIGRA